MTIQQRNMKTKNKRTIDGLPLPLLTAPSKPSPLDTAAPLSPTEKPTPLDFDAFVPWLCLEWQIPEVVLITRMNQEVYVCKEQQRRTSSSRSKSSKSIKFKRNDFDSDMKKAPNTEVADVATVATKSRAEHSVPLRAYYDPRGYLVEIAIIGCSFAIHKKIIQAINICVPFHSLLTKLTIRRGGLSHVLLYEISRLLPHSNITEVCLDDSFVAEGNYFILLEQTSQLKYLSLNRCCINDLACKEIAVRINFGSPAHSSLVVLELSSNSISDLGAKYLGNMLRTNRRLLHLNLSGNKITDIGAMSILIHLREFPLSNNEIVNTRQRSKQYTEEKAVVYEKCVEEVIRRQRAEEMSSVQSFRKSTTARRQSKSVKKSKKNLLSVAVEEQDAGDLAEIMTKEMMGDFEDPFDHGNVVVKDGYTFSTGNMTLCALNLSYNNLEFASVKTIQDVLQYQGQVVKPKRATGLLRIVIDGNSVPKSCTEYEGIVMCLSKAVQDRIPVSNTYKNRSSVAKKF